MNFLKSRGDGALIQVFLEDPFGTLLYSSGMHCSPWGVLHFGQAKPVNQILDQVADRFRIV